MYIIGTPGICNTEIQFMGDASESNIKQRRRKMNVTLPSEFSSSSLDHMLQQCSTCAVSKKIVCINEGEDRYKQKMGAIITFIRNKIVHLK